MLDLGFLRWLDDTVGPIILAYASGRLVDREDREQLVAALGIDYEAAAHKRHALDVLCEDTWIDLHWDERDRYSEEATAIVATALGDNEE